MVQVGMGEHTELDILLRVIAQLPDTLKDLPHLPPDPGVDHDDAVLIHGLDQDDADPLLAHIPAVR